MTQNERILNYLKLQPLCSLAPHGWTPPIHRPSARIQDLEDAGHVIEVTPCRLHGDCPGVTYQLADIDQLELF